MTTGTTVTTVFDSVSEWRIQRRAQTQARRTLGFVPTMGALHEGHLSLVRRSRAENDLTLVSIFVNPTQFDDRADLERYPRTLDTDLAALRDEGVDFVILPREADLYADRYRYRVTENELSTVLEGAQRPGHFDGVLTVVLKLLHLAAAERAYFGEKDWQQLTLVRGMADAFFMPTEIVACATVREADGLAMSSRNLRLPPADRARAPRFYAALSSAPTAEAAARELQASGFTVDYVEDRDGRRLGAVRLGGVRLIDNVSLPVDRVGVDAEGPQNGGDAPCF
jgi:pantoate--beta-alanine ligase